MSQPPKKSFIESIIMTLMGTIFGFILSFIILPLFGVPAEFETISGITIVFMFVGIIKNYLIRRLFNYIHCSDNFNKQNWNQSLFESSFQTVFGTIVSFFLSLLIYPMFGLDVGALKIGGITIVFMIVSVLKNLFVRRLFEVK